MERNGKVVTLGMRECYGCHGTGAVPVDVNCPKCGGTGKGPRGGKRGCRACHGLGWAHSMTEVRPCGTCHGTGKDKESRTDTMPSEWWLDATFKVYRSRRELSWNEAWLGYGCVFSCVDYGSAWEKQDEDVIEDVRRHSFVQLCHVARPVHLDGKEGDLYWHGEQELADHIGIFVTPGGYSVRPVFASDVAAVEKAIAREPGQAAGEAIGTVVANHGGHGVMAAAGII